MRLYLGLISGTSMDGVDAVIMDLNRHQLIKGLTYPYPKTLQAKLSVALEKGIQGCDLETYYQLNALIGKVFGQAALAVLEEAAIPAQDIKAIGSHGQTLVHDANASIPYTLQLGCPHQIAELTGIRVVADFRTRDLLLGGQGAPFAPIYHQALLQNEAHPLALLNIGGIANLTVLKSPEQVFGYDLGPGNCLMDSWIKKHKGLSYDQNGAWASSGEQIPRLLESLMQDAFFLRDGPKSIGREYFSLSWLSPHLRPEDSLEDIQATLLSLTARLIAKALKKEGVLINSLFVCGGGVHNLALMQALRELLPTYEIKSTQHLGLCPDFIEAAMFAWMASKTLDFSPLDLRTVTGAKTPGILGVIYPPGLASKTY